MRVPVKFNLPDPKLMKDGTKLRGNIVLEVFNNKEEMKPIGRVECHNIVVNEGLDSILDIMLHGSTQITTWYCVISETNTAAAAGMTYAVPVFTEWTAYDGGTRPEYNEAASSSQSVTNSANQASFVANATKTLYGAALVGGGSTPGTKDDQAGGGTLFNYGLFDASQPVVDDNVVNLTVTITAADDAA